MMKLNDFLKWVDNWNTTYIQIKGEKVAYSIGEYIVRHPNNWGDYRICGLKADNDDLIIEVYKLNILLSYRHYGGKEII